MPRSAPRQRRAASQGACEGLAPQRRSRLKPSQVIDTLSCLVSGEPNPDHSQRSREKQGGPL
jgi:hypothetical protein